MVLSFSEPESGEINPERFLIEIAGLKEEFPEGDIQIEKTYNKLIYSFDYEKNKDIIDKINNLEESILNKYIKVFNLETKKILTIKKQFQTNKLKIYYIKHIKHICKDKLILKISGLWIFNNEIGIIYKFLPCEI